MFLIATLLGPSAIHGLGVMAVEPVGAGSEIWRFEPGLDLVLPRTRVTGLPPAARRYLETYAYAASEFPDSLVLSGDNARFLNHSEDPNTDIRGRQTFARRDIATGDEITCDYRRCVEGWTGFG